MIRPLRAFVAWFPTSIRFVCLGLLGLGLFACARQDAAMAPGDPVAAVRAQAKALRDNDLVLYFERSLPPALQVKVEAQWDARIQSASPISELQRQQFAEALAKLTAKDAETNLFALYQQRIGALEKEIAGQWPMMQATASIFVKAAVEANSDLSDAEKVHASAAASAFLGWLKPTLLSDQDKARLAISTVSKSARALKLSSLDATRQLALRPALKKAGIGLAGLKALGKIYGLDADAAFDTLKVKLINANGDQATVKITYVLLAQNISFDLVMQRRDGAWYSKDALDDADALSPPALSAPASTTVSHASAH